jgi:hypothetical protein
VDGVQSSTYSSVLFWQEPVVIVGRKKLPPLPGAPYHRRAGLISIYLAGEDKSTKNVPSTTESTI